MTEKQSPSQWTTVIRPRTGWFDIDIADLAHYRDLVALFVKRNFIVLYKQTILGPLWILLGPLVTSVIFTLIFGGIAGIPTEGAPQFLFFMASNAIWGFFSSCLNGTANTFVNNAGLFGKVYFPRLAVPVSQVLSALVNFGIQLLMFLIFWVYFFFNSNAQNGYVLPNWWLLYLPVLLLQVMMLGLGVGIIVSSLTTKYRDLAVVFGFAVQLWMYATPVVYPLSQLSTSPRLRFLVNLNPMTEPLQVFRYALLGCGEVSVGGLIYSAVFSIAVLFVGVILFSRIEKTFMDTV